MIPKKDLVPGKYYFGKCRNSLVAKWDGEQFWYLRPKMDDTFAEAIKHPEDDDGFDLFVPVYELGQPAASEPSWGKCIACGETVCHALNLYVEIRVRTYLAEIKAWQEAATYADSWDLGEYRGFLIELYHVLQVLSERRT